MARKKAEKTEPKEQQANPLFELLDGMTINKTPWDELPEETRNALSPFMLNRFISSNEFLCMLAGEADRLKLGGKTYYEFMLDSLPKRKFYFNYKAYRTQKQESEDEKLIFAIEQEFEVGLTDAKRYLKLINKEEKETLISKWKDFYKK